MSMLRYLLAIILLSGIGGVAKADDFQMVVIDPLPNPVKITSDIFSVTLVPCSLGSYIGCFSGENDTGAPITSLSMLIPYFTYNGPQTAGCSPFGSLGGHTDIFSHVSCGTTTDGKDFVLNFSGGSIGVAGTDCDNDGDSGRRLNGDDVACSVFTIAEAGVPAADFPPFQVFANGANAANAPEPNSLLLLSTGVLSGGFFLANRRRRTLSPAGSQSSDN